MSLSTFSTENLLRLAALFPLTDGHVYIWPLHTCFDTSVSIYLWSLDTSFDDTVLFDFWSLHTFFNATVASDSWSLQLWKPFVTARYPSTFGHFKSSLTDPFWNLVSDNWDMAQTLSDDSWSAFYKSFKSFILPDWTISAYPVLSWKTNTSLAPLYCVAMVPQSKYTTLEKDDYKTRLRKLRKNRTRCRGLLKVEERHV